MLDLLVFSGKRYQVYSFGNGLSYQVKRLVDQEDVCLQGEDAQQFRDEWNAWETSHPDMLIDDIIGELIGDMLPYTA